MRSASKTEAAIIEAPRMSGIDAPMIWGPNTRDKACFRTIS
jgi:hypothetical protein